MKDELTTGEIAANLLGAKDIQSLVCCWIDKSGQATWYKIGGAVAALGMMEILKTIFLDEFCEEGEDERE